MKIDITTDATDKEAVDAYAAVTGWSADRGVTTDDWFRLNLTQYITQMIEAGRVNIATKPNLDTYIAAITASRAAVKTDMSAKPVAVSIQPTDIQKDL